MQSRERFFSRVGAVIQVAENGLAVDTLPLIASQNVVSRMLRASLTVSTFSYLESYLEDRIFEVMPILSKTRLPYASLPERFRKLVTVKAVQGIATRIGFEKGDPLGLAERHLKVVGHFARKRPSYSPMGFSSTGSNVTEAHVVEFLKDVGVEDAWDSLKRVLTEISYTPLSLRDDFTTLSRARNSCAHNPDFEIPSGDLVNFHRSAVRIGVAFDLLVSHVGLQYRRATTSRDLLSLVNSPLSPIAIVEPTTQNTWTLFINSAAQGEFENEIQMRLRAKSLASVLIYRDPALIPFKVVSF